MNPPRYSLVLLSIAAIPLWLSLIQACSQSVQTGASNAEGPARPLEIIHEACDVSSKNARSTDINKDGKPDIIRVMSGSREVCRAVDFRGDGRVDTYIYFDDQSRVRRRESDFDGDGRLDEVAIYKDGKLVRKDRETNLDGKLDTWDTFQNDLLVLRERDDNADGKIDQWWRFPDPAHTDCPIVDTDTDSDGKPDLKVDVCKEREAAGTADRIPTVADGGAPDATAIASSEPPAASASTTPASSSASPSSSAPKEGGKKK